MKDVKHSPMPVQFVTTHTTNPRHMIPDGAIVTTNDELTRLRAENDRLRRVAIEAQRRCDGAVREWAPELRAALAALSDPDTREEGR